MSGPEDFKLGGRHNAGDPKGRRVMTDKHHIPKLDELPWVPDGASGSSTFGDAVSDDLPPVASKSVEDCMRLADEYAVKAQNVLIVMDRDKTPADRTSMDEGRAALQAAIVAYGDAQWNDAIEAAAACARRVIEAIFLVDNLPS